MYHFRLVIHSLVGHVHLWPLSAHLVYQSVRRCAPPTISRWLHFRLQAHVFLIIICVCRTSWLDTFVEFLGVRELNPTPKNVMRFARETWITFAQSARALRRGSDEWGQDGWYDGDCYGWWLIPSWPVGDSLPPCAMSFVPWVYRPNAEGRKTTWVLVDKHWW